MKAKEEAGASGRGPGGQAAADAADLGHRFRLAVESIREYAVLMLDVEGKVNLWTSARAG